MNKLDLQENIVITRGEGLAVAKELGASIALMHHVYSLTLCA